MNRLARALRAKYPTQRDAFVALARDEDEPRSGREMAWSTLADHLNGEALEAARRAFKEEPDDDMALLILLEDIVVAYLNGQQRDNVQATLHSHLGHGDHDHAASDEDKDREDRINRRVDDFIDSWAEGKNLSADAIDELRPLVRDYVKSGRGDRSRDELPRNGLERPGGRLGQDRRGDVSAASFFPELTRIRTDGGAYNLALARRTQAADKRGLAHDITAAFGASRLSNAGGTGC